MRCLPPGAGGGQIPELPPSFPSIRDSRTQAERLFRRALTIDPTLSEARIRLAHLLGDGGRHTEAAAELKRLTTGQLPPFLDYYASLVTARTSRARGELDAARAAFEHAATVYPNAPAPRLGLSELAMAQGRPADSLAQLVFFQRDALQDAQTCDGAVVVDRSGARTIGGRPDGRPAPGGSAMTTSCRVVGGLLFAMTIAADSLLANRAPQEPVFASRVDTVRVDVSVRQSGRAVEGLVAADFEVLDNGVRQQVDFAALDQMPVNVVLALDMSGSVQGARLAQLQEAGARLVDMLGPAESAAVVAFTDLVTIRSGFTADKTTLVVGVATAHRGD